MAVAARETWHSVPSTGGPDHAFKFNWVYELPFGHGKKWGSGAGKFLNALIGGWELDGVARFQSGQKFNYGGYRLVGMDPKEVQDIFKFYHRVDANGIERIYMLPEDVIDNSILAFTQTSATSPTGYSGALPTGRYSRRSSETACSTSPASARAGDRASSPDRGSEGDMSFVKRFRWAGAAHRGPHGPLQRVRHHQLHGARHR